MFSRISKRREIIVKGAHLASLYSTRRDVVLIDCSFYLFKNSLVPGSIDLLCLPEMIFTGKENKVKI
jgi:hypothetical protein